MSETKTNFKNELKSAASLILTFSLQIFQHYHIHQNAPKVQCCYIMADMLNLKKWGWVTNRSGWLLELLTELKMAIYCPQGSGTLRQQYTLLCQSMQEYA